MELPPAPFQCTTAGHPPPPAPSHSRQPPLTVHARPAPHGPSCCLIRLASELPPRPSMDQGAPHGPTCASTMDRSSSTTAPTTPHLGAPPFSAPPDLRGFRALPWACDSTALSCGQPRWATHPRPLPTALCLPPRPGRLQGPPATTTSAASNCTAPTSRTPRLPPAASTIGSLRPLETDAHLSDCQCPMEATRWDEAIVRWCDRDGFDHRPL